MLIHFLTRVVALGLSCLNSEYTQQSFFFETDKWSEGQVLCWPVLWRVKPNIASSCTAPAEISSVQQYRDAGKRSIVQKQRVEVAVFNDKKAKFVARCF